MKHEFLASISEYSQKVHFELIGNSSYFGNVILEVTLKYTIKEN